MSFLNRILFSLHLEIRNAVIWSLWLSSYTHEIVGISLLALAYAWSWAFLLGCKLGDIFISLSDMSPNAIVNVILTGKTHGITPHDSDFSQ